MVHCLRRGNVEVFDHAVQRGAEREGAANIGEIRFMEEKIDQGRKGAVTIRIRRRERRGGKTRGDCSGRADRSV